MLTSQPFPLSEGQQLTEDKNITSEKEWNCFFGLRSSVGKIEGKLMANPS
jgi:hypothetical protein